MPRKKYYYKKKYYKKNNNDFNEDQAKAIAAIIVLFILFFYFTYIKFIKPNLESIKIFLEIFIPFLIISWLVIFYYLYKKRKEKEIERIKKTPEFLLNLENKIKSFRPIRNYVKEELYQAELTGYLKNNFDNLDIEETREYSRPDIVINETIIWDIAIEIKWPTDMQWLKTLPDKINKYLPKWDYLYIVLFNINISKYKTKEENVEIYLKKKNEILENIVESKKDKVFFIEIN